MSEVPGGSVPRQRAELLVGVSGAPESTPRPGTAHAVARCREIGLDALEIAWVHRVSIGGASAAKVAAAADAHAIRLSVHAPYYVNLNGRDPDIVAASRARVVAAARAAALVRARDVVLHLAFNHGDPPRTVFERVVAGLGAVRDELGPHAERVTLRPEVMGRPTQFGDLDEILRLCQTVPGTLPCIDIAHLHARIGAYNRRADFDSLWRCVLDALGGAALRHAHVHVSGIAYGPTGEQRHLALEESDLDYRVFLESMAANGVGGVLIAESPARERDALLLQETWRAIVG